MSEAWTDAVLSEVCTFENGDRGVNYPSKKVLVTSGIPFVNAGNLSNGRVVKDSLLYVTPERFELLSRGKFTEGDVLFCLRGSLGKFALVEGIEQGAIASSLVIVRPNTGLDTRYFIHYLSSDLCKKMIVKFEGGAAQPNLSAKDLGKFRIPLPPLAEQQRIVSILDEAFAAIDRAKEIAQQNLANARELFESYLNRVFTEKGEGWEEKTLGDLGRTQTGSTPKKANVNHYGDYIPFVKPADFHSNGTLNFGKSGLSEIGLENAREIPAGSALMVCIGATIGKSGFCESAITTNQQINAFIPSEDIDHRFAYYAFITREFQREVLNNSGQATLPIISKSKWSRLTISFPDRERQSRIVATLDGIKQQQLSFESVIDRRQAALDELKQSILQKAFTGQLTKDMPELENVS